MHTLYLDVVQLFFFFKLIGHADSQSALNVPRVRLVAFFGFVAYRGGGGDKSQYRSKDITR